MSHPVAGNARRVALFASCITEVAAPGPAQATVEVLEALGATVDFPHAQTCCGQPALNSGFPAQARMLARHWVETFEPYDAIVSPSGSCVAHVHHHLPRLLEGAWAKRSAEVAARTWELSQYLAAFASELPLSLEATVTVHDSCHMWRTLGERKSLRAVLAGVAGLRLVEMEDAESCCGFGGTFAAKFPEVSVAMADAKLERARLSGIDWLVSADPGCLAHLQARADRQGISLRTRHLAEIVRDALPARGDRP